MHELILRATRRACWALSTGTPVAIDAAVATAERVLYMALGAFVHAVIVRCFL